MGQRISAGCQSDALPGGRLFFGIGTSSPVKRADEVRNFLPADKKYQYSEGRSMAEAAKVWCAAAGYLPLKIAQVIGSDALCSAHFEYPMKVWGRGTSMTDIMAFVPRGVIAVEAKGRESFDKLVAEWIVAEAGVKPTSPPNRSRVIARYATEFGVSPSALMECRYQLLHRTLCAALAAKTANASRAWMIVQSFAPPEPRSTTVTSPTSTASPISLGSPHGWPEVKSRLGGYRSCDLSLFVP